MAKNCGDLVGFGFVAEAKNRSKDTVVNLSALNKGMVKTFAQCGHRTAPQNRIISSNNIMQIKCVNRNREKKQITKLNTHQRKNKNTAAITSL